MKLEPTEAQRKAMVDKLGEHVQWSRDGVEMAVDDMLTAANSIADGAPVGTIARRPDGAWKAERKAGGAGPYWHYSTSAFWRADSPDWNSEDDADSWPVIYDPTKPDAMTRLAKFEIALEEAVRSDPTAQQEPAYTVAAASEEMAKHWDNSIVTTTKREPRVVDRLGVDEQGSRWLDVFGWVWSFENGWWKTKDGSLDYGCVDPYIRGPFKEILEPRVLASLAYNEAREGAVWSIVTKAGVRRLFQCQSDRWHTRLDLPGTHWTLCENFGDGPYTEVLGDPS
ncbi:hypothetical protein RA984_20755 [Mycobacteroides abscessus subsp. massiliense]